MARGTEDLIQVVIRIKEYLKDFLSLHSREILEMLRYGGNIYVIV